MRRACPRRLRRLPPLLGAACVGAGAFGCDAAGTPHASEPSATVTQSGDTTIVVPALDGPTGRLVSDLVLGDDESRPDAVFGWIRDAALDPDAGIHVVDFQSSLVSRFNPDGSFDRVVSRGGEGPGEIYEPTRIAIGSAGQVAVANRHEVELFDASGVAVESRRFDREIQAPFRFTADGTLHLTTGPVSSGVVPWGWRISEYGYNWVAVVRPRPDTMSVVYRIDLGGTVTDAARAPWSVGDFPCIDVEGVADARICVAPLFASLPWFDWISDSRPITGHTGQYRLDIVAPSGSIVSLRPPRPAPPIGRELDAIVDTVWSEMEGDLAQFFIVPPHKPAIADVLPTLDGRIWVRLHAPSELSTDADGEEAWLETESRFDIFTPTGEHVGYVTGPADLTLRDVHGDTVLTTRTGALGVSRVERFLIDWSDPN